MQNMHKTSHDRALTGVHWPVHRSRCRGSGTKGDQSTSTGGMLRGAEWRISISCIPTILLLAMWYQSCHTLF